MYRVTDGRWTFLKQVSPATGMQFQSQRSSRRHNIDWLPMTALFEVVSFSQQYSSYFIGNSMLIDMGPFPVATWSSAGLNISKQPETLSVRNHHCPLSQAPNQSLSHACNVFGCPCSWCVGGGGSCGFLLRMFPVVLKCSTHLRIMLQLEVVIDSPLRTNLS